MGFHAPIVLMPHRSDQQFTLERSERLFNLPAIPSPLSQLLWVFMTDCWAGEVCWRRLGTVVYAVLAKVTKAVQFVVARLDNPSASGVWKLTGRDPAATNPSVERGLGHIQPASQIGKPPFVNGQLVASSAPVTARPHQAVSRQQLSYQRSVERGAPFRRMPSLLVELMRYLGGGLAGIAQRRQAGKEVVVVAQLFIASHGPHQLVLAGEAAGPVNGHVHALVISPSGIPRRSSSPVDAYQCSANANSLAGAQRRLMTSIATTSAGRTV